jgi:uncharacterized protein (TIGR02246 family)
MNQNDALATSLPEREAAIRHVLDRLQEGFTRKSGAIFASAFAEQHDYVVINGMFFPNMTREANAKVHQELFEGSRMGALGADLSQMAAPRYEVRNIRFLSPTIAVAHIASRLGGQERTIATAVMQQQDEEWRIVAFHNAPVLKPPDGPGA